jgi:3,4-dihydroxyphenylacetate 2,3-dioxygenase
MIARLAHADIATTDLERARSFYVDVLGFEIHQADADALYLRASAEFDVWSLKVTHDEGPGLISFGLRVDDPGDLEALARLHAERGLPYRELPPGNLPGRGAGLRVRTVGGHVVEFHHEIDEVDVRDGGRVRLPMRRTHVLRGVPPQRLDHVNLRVPDLPAALEYWREGLRFSMSECHEGPEGELMVAWLRRTPTSHDVAIARYETPGFHHVAYNVGDASALLRAADLLADAEVRQIEFGPGRHGVSDALAMYVRDPDGNRIELFAGDYVRDLDRPPIRWSWEDYDARGRLWWGQQPPATFRVAGPVRDHRLIEDAVAQR